MTDVISVVPAKTNVTAPNNDETIRKREQERKIKDAQFKKARQLLRDLEPLGVKEIKQTKVILDEENPLGEGAYGAVYRGNILIKGKPDKPSTHKYDKEGPFAVKRQNYTFQMYDEDSFSKVENEIKIHATVHSNEYILDLHYVSIKNISGDTEKKSNPEDSDKPKSTNVQTQNSFKMDGYAMMVMRLCETDLQKYCVNYQRPYEELNLEIDRIFYQISSGHRGLIFMKYKT